MRMFIVVAICVFARGTCQGEEKARTVTVSGQSEFRVAPDEAIITFSISDSHDTLVLAKAANDSQTLTVRNALKDLSLPAEDFKITRLTVQDRFDGNRRVVRGSTVTRSFEIRMADFKKIDQIVGGMADAAGDSLRIHDLTLQVRDQRKAQFESRRLAVEIAKEKATHLAELNQMKLGRVITIDEGVEYNPYAGGMGGGMGVSNTKPLPDDSQSKVVQRTTSSPLRTNVALVSQKKQAPPAEAKPPNNDAANKDDLLLPGLVILHSTVKIEFEMLPKD